MKLGLNHISASGQIGFGKYEGPIERLLRRPQKMNLECFGLHAKFHACRQICTIFPPGLIDLVSIQHDSTYRATTYF